MKFYTIIHQKKTSYNTSKIIKPENMMNNLQRMPPSQYARKIGGSSSNGVSTLKPAKLLLIIYEWRCKVKKTAYRISKIATKNIERKGYEFKRCNEIC